MAPKQKPEFSPLSVTRMLWKRKLLIGVASLIGCAAAIVIVQLLPPVYQAEALILVDSQKIPEHYVTSTVNTNVQDRLATISQQILSTTRLQKVIDNFGLYSKERKTLAPEEIIELMRKDIKIKLEKGWTGGQPGAFRVGYEGPNGSLVADVANQLANLFIEENLRTRARQAEGTADFIDSELAEAKKTLEEEEAKLSQYKAQHNGELPQQEDYLSQTLSRLQVQLEGNEAAISRTHQNKTMLQTALSIAEAEATALARPPERPPERTQAAQLAEATAARKPVKKSELMQEQYDTLSLRYGSSYPDMKVLKAQIEQQRKLEEGEAGQSVATVLATKPTPQAATAPVTTTPQAATAPATTPAPQTATAVATKPTPQAATAPVTKPTPQGVVHDPLAPAGKELIQARARVETIRSQLSIAEQEIATRDSERVQILHNIAMYQARIERLPQREQEMSQVTRDYEISKGNYKSLLDRKLAAGMATDMEHRQQGERFTLLDPARVPEKPVKPDRWVFSLLGCLGSLVLALGIGFGREAQRDTILGEWEIASDLPILGRVPVIGTTLKHEPGSSGSKQANRGLRAVLVSSAALAVLAMGAAGAHFYLRWF